MTTEDLLLAQAAKEIAREGLFERAVEWVKSKNKNGYLVFATTTDRYKRVIRYRLEPPDPNLTFTLKNSRDDDTITLPEDIFKQIVDHFRDVRENKT